ncbi:MAG TPA: NUDIX hydrolase [Candidatus Micrarchaeia archaeon]|nr:NUDIX hydrolase [Candidatus Micrarchaeia archaeon]
MTGPPPLATPADAGRRVAGAHAVIRRGDGRVLLQLRAAPPGWELPGGHVAPGEAPSATVVREAAEEIGCAIRVERLTGTYTFRGLRHSRDAVFLAHLAGGAPVRSRGVLALLWADPGRLPRSLFPWFVARIEDALAPAPPGGRPVHRVQAIGPAAVLGHGGGLAADAARAVAERVRPGPAPAGRDGRVR